MDEQTDTSSQNGGNKNLILIGAAVLIIIALVAAGGFVLTRNQSQSVVESPQETEEEIGEGNTPAAEQTASTYQDGTYEAQGTYSYHSGTETILVTVTLSGNIVEEVDVVSQAKAPTSKEKQADFIANYKEMVIGKNIDEINLTKVSGSSLTPIGFNDALDKIKADASS